MQLSIERWKLKTNMNQEETNVKCLNCTSTYMFLYVVPTEHNLCIYTICGNTYTRSYRSLFAKEFQISRLYMLSWNYPNAIRTSWWVLSILCYDQSTQITNTWENWCTVQLFFQVTVKIEQAAWFLFTSSTTIWQKTGYLFDSTVVVPSVQRTGSNHGGWRTSAPGIENNE